MRLPKLSRPAPAAITPPPSQARVAGFRYDAFGSYSTGADYRLVRRVEAFLESFHRLPNPTGPALPELALCVDGSDFSIARARAGQRKRGVKSESEIESLVAEELRQSQRLLVFCPGRKLQGRWSDWETQWFLKERAPGAIYLVITRGRDPWENPGSFFSESIFAAGLHGGIAYDLRGARWWARWRWKNVRDFDDELSRLAADLYDRSLGEVQPVWLRQRRRTLRAVVHVAMAVSCVLLLLTGFALWQRGLAESRRLVAEHQTRLANSRALAAQSTAALTGGYPQRALLLAVEALRVTESAGESRVIDAEQAVRAALAQTGGIPLRGHWKPVWALAMSPDGRWLATTAEDGQLLLWNPAQPAASRPLGSREGMIEEVRFSPDGKWLAARARDHGVELWNLQDANAPRLSPGETKNGAAVKIVFSPANRWLATTWDDGCVELRDLQAPHTPARRLTGHRNPVTDLAFTPDEARLVTASDKQFLSEKNAILSMEAAARVWDLRDPQSAPRILRGHEGSIECLVLSHDGRWLLTGSSDQTVKVWDLAVGDDAAKWTLHGHTKGVSGVAISTDGRWAASGGFDGVVSVWDLQAADPAASAVKLAGHGGTVRDVEFSADGRWLLTHGTKDNEGRLWTMDGSRPAERSVILRGHRALVQVARFTPDGRWVLTAGDDKVARLWDLRAPDPSAKPVVLAGHEDSAAAIALSEDGSWVAVASGPAELLPRVDPTARLWNLRTLNPVASPKTLAVDAEGGGAISRADGEWIATTAADFRVRLWRRKDDHTFVLGGHTDRVGSMLFTPDGRWLATAGEDGTAQLFDLRRDDPSIAAFQLKGHPGAILHAALSPDGHWLATGDNETTAMLWDFRAPDPARSGRVLLHPDSVTALAWTPDSSRLITGCSDDAARIWEIGSADPAQPQYTLPDHGEDVEVIAVSGDGHWLATAPLYRSAVHLWNLRAADPPASRILLDHHHSAIRGIVFSADNRWMITRSADTVAQLYDLQSAAPQPRALAGHTEEITTSALSADGRWLATGSADNSVRLWDLRASDPGKSSVRLLGHSDRVEQLAFTASGDHLLSASADGTVRLWRVTDLATNDLPLVLPAASGGVLSMEIVASGRLLVTGAADGIRIWPLSADQLATEARRVAGRELRPDEAIFLPPLAPREPTPFERLGTSWRALRNKLQPR